MRDLRDLFDFKKNRMFDFKGNRLPVIGASSDERMRKKAIANRWFYVLGAALSSVFLTFYIAVEYEPGVSNSLKVSWMFFLCFISGYSLVEVLHSKNMKTLLSECTDGVLLKKVVDAAEKYPAVARQLQECLSPADRDYLCWYEVFALLDEAEDEAKANILQDAKNKITSRINT